MVFYTKREKTILIDIEKKNKILSDIKKSQIFLASLIDKEYLKDYDIALALVSNYAINLQFLDEKFRDTEEIVKAALENDYVGILYASERLYDKFATQWSSKPFIDYLLNIYDIEKRVEKYHIPYELLEQQRQELISLFRNYWEPSQVDNRDIIETSYFSTVHKVADKILNMCVVDIKHKKLIKDNLDYLIELERRWD